MNLWPNTSLEPTPVTPVSFRCGFGLAEVAGGVAQFLVVRRHAMSNPIYCCHVCGAVETEIVGLEVGGVQVALPHQFVFVYREADKPLGLCNLCFGARRFNGFTAAEISYFEEQFNKQDDTSDA